MAILKTEMHGSVLVAQFNHAKPNNPMSRELEAAILETCRRVETDPAIHALLLTGGPGRSFCAGGDFAEVAKLTGRVAVEAFIDRVFDLYCGILQVTKPTVAAMDGYAIGVGFQVALCCDWRVGTPDTQMLMWELKHGCACTVGGYMLERLVGRAAMLDIIYGCAAVPVTWAASHKLLNDVVEPDALFERALGRAQQLAGYAEITFRKTKEAVNGRFISGLRGIVPESKEAHVAGFASKAAEAHFQRILQHEPG